MKKFNSVLKVLALMSMISSLVPCAAVAQQDGPIPTLSEGVFQQDGPIPTLSEGVFQQDGPIPT